MKKRKNRYVSALVWKKRTPKKRRAKVVELMRVSWPEIHDTPEALVIPHHDARDAKLFWLFLLSGDFSEIHGGER